MRRPNACSPTVDSDSSSPFRNMEPMKLLIRPPNRSNFAKSSQRGCKSKLVVSILTITLVLAFVCILTRSSRSRHSRSRRYGIVIDGGSTGTRIHVFEYQVEDGSAVFEFGDSGLASLRVNPGLSAYADDPEGAGGSLKELLEFAKRRVPREFWAETEIRLMATAGMRLLELGVQRRILESARRTLVHSGFKFQPEWASVITGSDEGVYAWVIANYALGTLGDHPAKTTGIIELGGASAQVTFVSNEHVPLEFLHPVKFGNFTYNLYSHSLLHFGQNVALDSLRQSIISGDFALATGSSQNGMSIDPCTPKGYSHDSESWNHLPSILAEKRNYLSPLYAKGNFSECRSAALTLLQKGKEKCSYHHCYLGSTFIPKLQGKFLATENFFYTSQFFGLGPRTFLSDLMAAGQKFCGEDWSKLKEKHHSRSEEDLLHYCFSSAYIVALLHDSLEVPMEDERIEFTNHVENIPLDWALGAFILQTSTDMTQPGWISSIISDDSPTMFSLIGFSGILIFTAWLASKWRKPQWKTIYDLEKGRYIVTRINRS